MLTFLPLSGTRGPRRRVLICRSRERPPGPGQKEFSVVLGKEIRAKTDEMGQNVDPRPEGRGLGLRHRERSGEPRPCMLARGGEIPPQRRRQQEEGGDSEEEKEGGRSLEEGRGRREGAAEPTAGSRVQGAPEGRAERGQRLAASERPHGSPHISASCDRACPWGPRRPGARALTSAEAARAQHRAGAGRGTGAGGRRSGPARPRPMSMSANTMIFMILGASIVMVSGGASRARPLLLPPARAPTPPRFLVYRPARPALPSAACPALPSLLPCAALAPAALRFPTHPPTHPGSPMLPLGTPFGPAHSSP